MNVLVVEDNPISSKVLQSTLENHGYTSITARDGNQAIEQLAQHPEINLIIMDIVMPNANGFELHKILKQSHDWQEIPIIFCTSMKPEELAKASLRVEGWQYLVKPIRADSLIEKVKQVAAKQRPFLQSIDHLMSQLGLDGQSFLDLSKEFVKVIGEKISQLEQRGTTDAPLDFQDLLEGAKLLGAERVIHALDRLARAKVLEDVADESLYLLLLRELKGLRHYLDAYAAKDAAQLEKELNKVNGFSSRRMIPWESLDSLVPR